MPEVYRDDDVELRDLWSVLRRRRWTVLGTLLGVILLVGAYTWLKTPVWRASALVRVDDGDRSNVAVLDVLASLQRGSEIETEMRILRTRPILAEVADDLDLGFRVKRPAGIPRGLVFQETSFDRSLPEAEYSLAHEADGRWRLEAVTVFASGLPLRVDFRPGEPVEIPGGRFVLADLEAVARETGRDLPSELRIETVTFDDAVRDLGEMLEVTRPDREANVVQVSYESTDRDLAWRVPNAAAATFIEQRQEVQKTEVRSTVAFLSEQTELLQTQLEAAERELQGFREARQIVALGPEAAAQVRRLADLQTQRTQLDAERSALSNLLTAIEVASTRRPDYRRLAAFPTFLGNQAIADLLQSLTAAENARTELLARYTSEHPDVVTVDGRIEDLERQLGDIGRNYLRAVNDQIASLDAVLARFGSDLEQIPGKEIQFARLQRRTEMLGELHTMLQKRLKEAEIAEAVEDPRVRVVEAAALPDRPVSPRPVRNMTLALVLGLMTGIGLAFGREYMDDRIHAAEEAEEELGFPAIGRIPTLPRVNGRLRGDATLVTVRATTSPGAEAFRTLRTNVRFVRGGAGAREMVVTSPGPREGKSLTAANLATAFAQQGLKVLLVDADMRRSVQHFQFGVEREPGLSQLLAGEGTLEEAVRHTEVEGLDVLTAGAPPPNPSELLGTRRLAGLLARARELYDVLVIDSPPVLAVTDATVMAPIVEGVVLVVRAGQTDRRAAARALAHLEHVGATVLGIVLNDARAEDPYARYYAADYGPEPSGWRRLLTFRG